MPDNKEMCNIQRKRIDEIQQKTYELEKTLIGVSRDIKYIRESIDNNISKTINKLCDTITQEVMPVLNDSKFWIGRFKQAIFWLSIMGICGSLIAFTFKVIYQGGMGC